MVRCCLRPSLLLAAVSAAITLAKGSSLLTPPKEGRTKESWIKKNDLQGNWVSLHEQVEFLPAPGFSSPEISRALASFGKASRKNRLRVNVRRLDEQDEEEEEEEEEEENPQYRVQPFVEGVSEYDEYQQAWRLLGFMIDCDDMRDDDNYQSGSQDQNDTGEGCSRYVVWAAYVDLEYEGGGLGEYQYWDRYSQSWDTTTCLYDQNGQMNRCAKMDCHEPDTHWSLLGFFKHRSYDDWMEQLFKHEGVCIWTDDEYSFMKNARETWPQGCVQSSTTTSSGDSIYYDVKPVSGGGITLGLYTDAQCATEYVQQGRNDPITLENVIGNILVEGGSGSGDNNNNNNNNNEDYEYDTLEESLEAWDSAFDIFKICQPCIAHDLNNVGYNYDDDSMHGSSYGTYSYGDDDSYSNYQAADFDCYDDADYTNVNQCMKFMAKTEMKTATFRDLALANAQGTLVENPLSGYRLGQKHSGRSFSTFFFLFLSTCLFIYGSYNFRKVQKETNSTVKNTPDWDPKRPLVFA